jgi:hypothetical protein
METATATSVTTEKQWWLVTELVTPDYEVMQSAQAQVYTLGVSP